MNRVRYEDDLAAWAEEQASLLRAGEVEGLDREHLAEEIESVGARARRELRGRLARLLQQLAEVALSAGAEEPELGDDDPRQRDEIGAVLADSPSLHSRIPELLAGAYRLAGVWATEETGLLKLPDAWVRCLMCC